MSTPTKPRRLCSSWLQADFLLVNHVLRWSGTAAFSNWPDYLGRVGLSVSRLLMHVAPFSSLTVSVALAARWPQPT